MSQLPLLLLPLLLWPIPTQPGPSPDPGPIPAWQLTMDGTEWLAALDAPEENLTSPSPPTRMDGSSCAAAGNCDLELRRRERLEVVKLKILSELGLEAPPERRRRQVAAEFLSRVISEQKLVTQKNKREVKLPTDDTERQAVWTLAKQCKYSESKVRVW